MAHIIPLQLYLRPNSALLQQAWKLSQLAIYLLFFAIVTYGHQTFVPGQNSPLSATELIWLSIGIFLLSPLIAFILSFNINCWPGIPALPEDASPKEIVLLVEEAVNEFCKKQRKGAKAYVTQEFAIYLADPDRAIHNGFSRIYRVSFGILIYSFYSFTSVFCLYVVNSIATPEATQNGKVATVIILLCMVYQWRRYMVMANYISAMSGMAEDIRENYRCAVLESGALGESGLAEVIEGLLKRYEKEDCDREERQRIIRASIGDVECPSKSWRWNILGYREPGVVLV